MEHVKDLDETYKAMKEWLKPDGIVSHRMDFQKSWIHRRVERALGLLGLGLETPDGSEILHIESRSAFKASGVFAETRISAEARRVTSQSNHRSEWLRFRFLPWRSPDQWLTHTSTFAVTF